MTFVRKEAAKESTKEPEKKTEKAERAHRVKRAKKRPPNVLERLGRVADRRLGMGSKQMLIKLEADAKEGKVGSARLLVALAEKKKPTTEPETAKRSIGMDWLSKLAAEPEWNDGEAGNREEGLGNRD